MCVCVYTGDVLLYNKLSWYIHSLQYIFIEWGLCINLYFYNLWDHFESLKENIRNWQETMEIQCARLLF